MKQVIHIMDPSGATIEPERLSRRDAWILVTTFWNTRMERVDLLRSMKSTVDRLVDVTHSLGATITGSAIAMVTWIAVSIGHVSLAPMASVITTWTIVIAFLTLNYRHTLNSLQSIIDSTVAEAITFERGAATSIDLVLASTSRGRSFEIGGSE